ncbi:MAG: energy transducer TonB, partial [Candidatus Omnitrophota bacterium]
QEAVIENASPKTKSYDLITDYVHTVQQKISQAISYPYEAIENGWQGTVKLTLRILKDGTLDEASIKESSGHNIFDKDALNTAQILAPFPAFPLDLDLEEIIITLPIVYSQDAVSASADSVCRVNVDSKKKELTQSFVPSGKPYAALIQEQIAQALIYPQEAKEKKWQGTAVLTLRILRDGTLAHATVEESSGYKIFDECAMQTAKSVAPYAIFPAEANQDEVNVTVPIVYSLERK